MKKHGFIALVILYLIQVYGSSYAYEFGLMTMKTWETIHFIGIQVFFIGFTHLLKNKITPLWYSVGIGLFTARLISQLFYGSFEEWYEIILVLTLPIIIYYIQKLCKSK